MTRSSSLQYPIRAVARLTGLSLDTIRAWERRYAAVTPARGDRGRLYSEQDVDRLKRLGELVARGHAIGTVAPLEDAELTRLIAASDARTPEPPTVTPARLDDITRALDSYDLPRIEQELNRFAATLPPRDLIFAVVLPLLTDVGDRWQAGTLRPAQEHLVSAIVRSVLGSLLRAISRPEAGPRVVFAAPSGERHELGLLGAAVLTAAGGFGTVYLGPDLPADDIWDAAARADARLVVVSLTAPGVVTRAELRALARVPPGARLWVGGPASRELLAITAGDTAPRVEHIESLAGLPAMLERHAR